MKRKQADAVPTEQLERAWEELFIAEGSDWFWWYGDDHSSAQDSLFDQLFRKHLQNVYLVLDETPPANLHRAISRGVKRAAHTQPTGSCRSKSTGGGTYFEWISAGLYLSGNDRGTMTIVTAGLFKQVHFGFDAQNFYLRIDTANARRRRPDRRRDAAGAVL